MKIFNLICISFIFLVTGCDKVENLYKSSIKPVKVAISPGYKVDIDGKLAYIFGSSECPKEDPIMARLLGSNEPEAKNECIVITPETKNVKVLVVFNDHISNEDWKVIRKDDITYLATPNGILVGRYIENNKSTSSI
jgi:hypothetical protein